MKKMLALLLVIVLIGGLAVGCQNKTTDSGSTKASGEAQKDEIIIGLSMSAETQFLVNVRNAIVKKGNEMGVKIIRFSGDNKVEKQINDIESLIAQKVDAIIMNPLDREALGNVVDKVKDAGIPLVQVNTFTSNDRYDVYVGSPEEDAGKIQGEFIKKAIGTEGNVVILYGEMGHSGQIGRYEGLKQSLLDECPDWNVLADQTGMWQRDQGLRITEDWLQRFQDIDVVASQNDEMAMGALQAVEAAGKQDEILVLGIDASPDAIEAVKEGRLALTVFQDSFGQGQRSVEVAVGLVEGKTFEKNELIPFVEVNKDNAEDFIEKLKEWE